MRRFFLLTINIVTLTFLFFSNISYSKDTYSFDYKFSKKKIGIAESFNLTITIVTDNSSLGFIDFDRKAINSKGFVINNFDYSVEQIYNVNEMPKIVYDIDFEIGLLFDEITKFGIVEFPAFEIRLRPISKNAKTQIYEIGSENIEVTKSMRTNIILLSILTSIILFLATGVIIVVSIMIKKKNVCIANKTMEKDLSNNVYKRFIEKKEEFKRNKDVDSFLSTVEQLINSYVLRKCKITNMNDFFAIPTISSEAKIGIRNLLRNIERYDTIEDFKWNSDELEKFETDFKTLLFASK